MKTGFILTACPSCLQRVGIKAYRSKSVHIRFDRTIRAFRCLGCGRRAEVDLCEEADAA